MLGGSRVDGLEPVEAGVLSVESSAELGEDGFAAAAGGEVSGDDLAGLIDAAAAFPALLHLLEPPWLIGRKSGGRYVEEAVEVHA